MPEVRLLGGGGTTFSIFVKNPGACFNLQIPADQRDLEAMLCLSDQSCSQDLSWLILDSEQK